MARKLRGRDKLYCVYIARDPEIIREHARRGGFPVGRIMQVHAVIDSVGGEKP